jgi:hypothetical protein
MGWIRSAPGVTAAVVLLVLLAAAYWRADTRPSTPVARLANLQATLRDGAECRFSADVVLTGRWARFAFDFRESAIRGALVEVVGTRSRYMVNTGPARESLRSEMLRAVNGVIGRGRAASVRLPEFELP